MKTEFAGWNEVARHLIEMADETSLTGASLNKGQRASLKALASRIITNGVVIADEVGMGKTRIAAFVAKAVSLSGGRCAVVIPPGLGFQWQDEFKTCGAPVKPVIRSLWGYFEPWDGPEGVTAPWFRQPIVMISHRFSNWRLGETTQTWRWCLLPEIFAAARQLIDGRLPRGYHEYAGEYAGNVWVQRVATAARSIVQSVPAKSSNPARRLVSDLLSKVRWPEPLYPQNYGRQESLRDHLEAVVGLGLGVFDLVIIDEAHKSRGDDSGLSRVLEKVVLEATDSRRIALTATPIELDDRQWSMTFKRIAIRSEEVDKINIATTQYGESIRRLRLGWRASEALRADYHKAALQFKDTLSPYLLRRDKREDEDVLKFEKYSGLPIHDYRRQEEISVDLNDLSPAWRQAVCAAEALSVIRAPAADPKTKRLRLTIGNGHGIASVIDEALRDEAEDRKQDQFETSQVEIERIVSIAKTGTSASDRLRWWEDKLRRSFTSSQDILFDHPAILAAVENIEHETEQGEKVLVFGRFTRPLRTLVSLLNARQMLLQIANGGTWPQRKVYGDRIANYGESEWPAVVAAHRQLASSIDLDTLDDVLSERYRKDTELRIKQRDALVQRIRAGLETVPDNGKYSALLKIIEQHSSSTTDESEDDDRHLTLLLRAITANLDNPEASDADIASAFITLVNAASDRDTTDEEEFDDEKALFAWKNLEEYLAEGYTNRQGGFARLMYGETKPQTRRMIQLAFNRPNSFPRVLVAQSLVGREGLNLHESCRIVILLHPEWNPGVVEQQIGRVDRVNCRWAKELNTALLEGKPAQDLPRIVIRPVIFKGTYDEHNWKVLQDRWDDLRAQLHGEAIPARLRVIEDDEGQKIFDKIAQSRPDFSPAEEKTS
jgi:superfamily II DNA or RNA helicase